MSKLSTYSKNCTRNKRTFQELCDHLKNVTRNAFFSTTQSLSRFYKGLAVLGTDSTGLKGLDIVLKKLKSGSTPGKNVLHMHKTWYRTKGHSHDFLMNAGGRNGTLPQGHYPTFIYYLAPSKAIGGPNRTCHALMGAHGNWLWCTVYNVHTVTYLCNSSILLWTAVGSSSRCNLDWLCSFVEFKDIAIDSRPQLRKR